MYTHVLAKFSCCTGLHLEIVPRGAKHVFIKKWGGWGGREDLYISLQ